MSISSKAKVERDPSRFLSVIDIAHDIRRSRAFVYERVNSGELRARKVTGVLRIERAEFERWLTDNSKRYQPGTGGQD